MPPSFAAGRAAPVLAPPGLTPVFGLALILAVCLPLALLPRGEHHHIIAPTAVHTESRPHAPGDQLLGIDAAGQYYLNRRPIRNETLGAELATLFAGRAADRVLHVASYRDLEYRVVVEALEVARGSGVRVARLVTESRE